MIKSTLLLSILTIAVSCVSEEPIETEIPSTSDPAEVQDGDDGEGIPIERPAFSPRDPSFSSLSPCGEHTVDVLTVAPNHTVAFCETSGSAMVIEMAPLGHPAIVPEDIGCAAQLYAQLAPTRKVPDVLLTQCSDDELRQSVLPISLDHLPQDGEVDNDAYSHYCGSNGPSEFAQERCYTASNRTNICRSTDVSWHQRTCKLNVGDWCSHADQVIASCGGSTRFLVRERKRFRNNWGTFYDYDIHSGYWASSSIRAASRPGFGWYDWDFRMIGDSYSSADHRYSVSFRKR
ncbi:MAG: hypothetical protein JKY56_07945 [Kofleriaceae bacterium]|nr:hypothetical protein [Kofleriaceae bacterium]